MALAGLPVACWGKPSPPVPTGPKPVIAIAPAKPRGVVLVAHVPPGKTEAVLFWNDFDANKTGEHDRNVTLLLRPMTNTARAIWFSNDDEVMRVSRPVEGPGVIVTELSTDRIWAVSPDGKHAVIGCANLTSCSIGMFTDTGVIDERPLADSIMQQNVGLEAWLSDGRLLYVEKSQTPTLWYLDPKTEKSTRGKKLAMPFQAIADDGSLVAWYAQIAHGKQVIRWKRLSDEHEMSLDVAGSAIGCRFTPTSRFLYCVVAPVNAPRVTDENEVLHNRLLVIEPATGRSRELGSDLPLLDAYFTAGSADGRYLAYTSNVDGESQRPLIVDLLSGETFPAGPAAVHAYVVGWLAPR